MHNRDHIPKWSVMIPTHNCADYLVKTLSSVLAQDSGIEQMQIEVIDDFSELDDPFDVVKRIGKGRVDFHQHKQNIGPINNFNACIERAHGEFIHILHGDDWVEDGFYEEVNKCLTEYPQVGIVITGTSIVNSIGEHIEYTPPISALQYPSSDIKELLYINNIRTPSVVVRKSAYMEVGNFNPKFDHTADWEMWVRLIKSKQGVYIDKPLANYRLFENNDSSKMMRSGKNILSMELLYRHFSELGYMKYDKNLNIILQQKAMRQCEHFYRIRRIEFFIQNNKVLFRYLDVGSMIRYLPLMVLRIFILFCKHILESINKRRVKLFIKSKD